MTQKIGFLLRRPAEQLSELLAAIETFGIAHDLNAALRFKLGLLVDELVANCIAHGAEPGSDMSIRVEVEDADNELHLRIQDSGPAFDPTTHPLTRCPESGPVQIGGMGLCIVRNLASSVSYARVGDRNHLRITLHKNTGEKECSSTL